MSHRSKPEAAGCFVAILAFQVFIKWCYRCRHFA